MLCKGQMCFLWNFTVMMRREWTFLLSFSEAQTMESDAVVFTQAAHPNMRTYYFCTDTGKEMELWMKAMLDAALVQTEPVKRYSPVGRSNASQRGFTPAFSAFHHACSLSCPGPAWGAVSAGDPTCTSVPSSLPHSHLSLL